jgi:hypothetical protein
MTKQIEAIPVFLAVVMEGGPVQSVVSNTVLPDLNVLVIDYDTQGANPDDLVSVPQPGGGAVKAWSSLFAIVEASIDLATVVHQLTAIQREQS